jgi:hypothetical protein
VKSITALTAQREVNEVIDLFVKSISLTFANRFIRMLRNGRFGACGLARNGAKPHF